MSSKRTRRGGYRASHPISHRVRRKERYTEREKEYVSRASPNEQAASYTEAKAGQVKKSWQKTSQAKVDHS